MMRKICIMFLCLCLLLPTFALAERLVVTVNDTFACDAELPAGIPDSLPTFAGGLVQLDAEKVISLLMPDGQPIEDVMDGGITVGIGDGKSEYMLIESKHGRVFYVSAFANIITDFAPQNESEPSRKHLPLDKELDFLSMADAKRQALELMKSLGLEVSDDAEVYTLERESYGKMQDILRDSEWITYEKRERALRQLEPLAEEHEGYFVVMKPLVNGLQSVVFDDRWSACVLITRQGIEYVDTGFHVRKGDEIATKPLIPAEEALITASSASVHMMNGKECVIEQIMLAYRFDNETKTLTPVWVFLYCNDGPGGLQKRDFDHYAQMYGIAVDAHTGKLLPNSIF